MYENRSLEDLTRPQMKAGKFLLPEAVLTRSNGEVDMGAMESKVGDEEDDVLRSPFQVQMVGHAR